MECVYVHVKTISPKHECFVVECGENETLTTFPFHVKSVCKNDETSSEDEEEDSDDSDEEEESDDDSDDDDSDEDEVTTKRRRMPSPPREAKKRKTVAIQCSPCIITRSIGTQVGEFDLDESESLGGSSPLWTGLHF